MFRRIVLVIVSCFCIFGGTVSAQPGDRELDMKARVLDVLFPLNVAQKPYFLKMILRFGDSDTQLVVVVYPDKDKYWIKRYEMISYSLSNMKKGGLSDLVSEMVAEKSDVTAEEIAAKVKVVADRSPINPGVLGNACDELKTVRVSPVLASRVSVDGTNEFDFWYDQWQESVHYTLNGPFRDKPQDELVQWMIKFRAGIPNLLKTGIKVPTGSPEKSGTTGN